MFTRGASPFTGQALVFALGRGYDSGLRGRPGDGSEGWG